MRTNILLASLIISAGIVYSAAGCEKEVIEPTPEIVEPTPEVIDTVVFAPEVESDPPVVVNSNLPPFNDLYCNYLQYGSHVSGGGTSDAAFADIVGGLFEQNVDSGIFANTCASRVSHALNLSGDPIPYMSGKTSSGGNGFKYIFRVIDLTDYMYNTYGQASLQGTNMSDFIGKKGIIIFNTQGLWSDASGHATIWNESVALGGNYAENPSFYFNNSVNVMLWEAN